MNKDFEFTITSTPLNEEYSPSETTRITTNYANLARGEHRKANLRNALQMINNRFNALATWDNLTGQRYAVELDIITVEVTLKAPAITKNEINEHSIKNSAPSDSKLQGANKSFPAIEVLKTTIVDTKTKQRTEGIVGNNFSSYLRDYDFSVVLPAHNKGQSHFSVPDNFGDLHGTLFQQLVQSNTYKAHFSKLPVICISVSDSKVYHRTENEHPILGVEYIPNETSLTESYFKKMGLNVRYFMPPNSVAPFAFYFSNDLLNDYTNLELISTISTMETFQKIYRPEIYNANAVAGKRYQPNLRHQDHSVTRIVYDIDERTKLGVEQGKFVEETFIKPYRATLKQYIKQRA